MHDIHIYTVDYIFKFENLVIKIKKNILYVIKIFQ